MGGTAVFLSNSKIPPVVPGHGFTASDVDMREIRQPWVGHYHMDQRDFDYPRFDGTKSGLITRETYVTGEASVILPYDPVRDRIMVIEQFRIAAVVRGDQNPWMIECPAGRIDEGETPEECALRETREECGLTINTLVPAANYYPSVGGNASYFHTFVGLCDIPNGADGVHGLREESEDIKSHIISFADAWTMVENGQFNTGPLIQLILWLGSHRKSMMHNA